MNTLETYATISRFSECAEFLNNELSARKIPNELIEETVNIFEELFLRIDNACDDDTHITLYIESGLSGISVVSSFECERFTIDYDSNPILDPGIGILSAYQDKISTRYSKGINSVSLIVKRHYDRAVIWGFLSIIAGLVVYVLTEKFLGIGWLFSFVKTICMPVVQIFGNTMLMISAPVTFFTLIDNFLECGDLSTSKRNYQQLILKILLSCVLIGAVLAVLLNISTGAIHSYYGDKEFFGVTSAEEFLEIFIKNLYTIVPSDIFSIFTMFSPFPLLILAFLNIFAIRSMDKHYSQAKGTVSFINDLFNRILSVIMLLLPVAAFFSTIVEIFAYSVEEFFHSFIFDIGISVAVFAILTVIYSIFLALNGINPFAFFKTCLPAFIMNFRINSCADAVPYNQRFMSRRLGIDRKMLDYYVPVLARINLQGTFSVLFMIAVVVAISYNMQLNPLQLVLVCILVTGLSFGAPNQPGAIIIGMIVIYSFYDFNLETYFLSLFVYYEVIIGGVASAINTMGDYVMIAVVDKRNRTKKIS